MASETFGEFPKLGAANDASTGTDIDKVQQVRLETALVLLETIKENAEAGLSSNAVQFAEAFALITGITARRDS